MELRSQAVRKLAPENDPLKIGMGWKVDDLAKPQIMVESTFGDSHPGSAHLDQFVKEAVQAVNTHGGKAARYFATDMCDGIAQGHDGINYSLPHRDAIVNLVEGSGQRHRVRRRRVHRQLRQVHARHADEHWPPEGYERHRGHRRRDGSPHPAQEVRGQRPRLRHQRPADAGTDRQVRRMGKDGRDPQRAAGLLQAQCLPQLRCLLLYGHRFLPCRSWPRLWA